MGTLTENDDDNEISTDEGVEIQEDTKAEAEPTVDVVEDERLAADEGDADQQPQRHKETARERRERAKAAKERDKKPQEDDDDGARR